MHCLEECADGYERESTDQFECKPICHQCLNGICTAPYECECHAGYQSVNDGNETSCIPICLHCDSPNRCDAPHECECDVGYVSEQYSEDEYNGIICRPHCDMECGFGICHAPQQCLCDDGFDLVNGTCIEKICPCENGYCVQGVCECDTGYFLTASGLCEYEHANRQDHIDIQCEDDSCTPTICIPGCENSHCIENNTCECYMGFVAHPEYNHICEPNCELGCINGKCTAPNHCECLNGLKLNEDNMTCVPASEQQHELSIQHNDERHTARTYFLTLLVILLLAGIIIGAFWYKRFYAPGNQYILDSKGFWQHYQNLMHLFSLYIYI